MTIFGFLNPVDNVHQFDPDKHIPSLAGKVIVVTGGNSGVGKETVLQLAKHGPGRLYLAARSRAKYDEAMRDIEKVVPDSHSPVRFLELDLASLASVKRAADTVLAENDRCDILVNNAGIMAHPHGVTEDGYEVQFGTNHVGHALLTRLLLPLLEKTAAGTPGADGRIVNVSSAGHMFAGGGGIQFDQLKTDMRATSPSAGLYPQSKLANVLHARELARRHPDILSTSVHPGRVETNIAVALFDANNFMAKFQRGFDYLAGCLTVQQGALTQIWAATWKRDEVTNGAYYVPVGKENKGSGLSRNAELAAKLWDWTESELAAKGY